MKNTLKRQQEINMIYSCTRLANKVVSQVYKIGIFNSICRVYKELLKQKTMHSAYLAQLRTEMISALRLAFSLLVSQAIAAHFAKAQIDAFSPLLTPVTSFEIRTIYSTLTKPTVCFVTNGQVSACRRRRGVLEEADFINPSQITK